jgi:PKD repeat protein
MRSSSALRLNRLGCALAACAAAFIVNSAAADTASVGLPAPWVSTATKALPPVASIARTPVDAAMPVHLIVSLQLRDKAALQTFIHNQHTPGNPQYGTVMTTAQFLAAHAPTADQAQAVRDYLAQAGFHNIRIATNRTLVSADGSAAAAQSAFNTQLVRYQVGGRTVFSNTSDAQVPAALAGTVLAVLGLQNVGQAMTHRQQAQRVDLPVAQGATVPAVLASGDPTGATLTASYTAADFRRAYDADAAPDGSNTTVAIISAGTDLVQVRADLQQAERDAGLPYIPVSVVQTEPVPDPQASENDGEWDLDSQSASGIAYNVKQIIFYNGAALDTGITLGANQFAADNVAKALNISIGGCEVINAAVGAVDTDDQAFMQAVAQGQTVFVSSGDAGAACGVLINLATPQGGVPQQAEYPASSPYVVAVGGTSLFLDASGNYALETAWAGGGGGVSVIESAPDWQTGSGVAAVPLMRGVPDVAMNAGFNLSPAAAFYSTADTVVGGRHEGVIGTSLSSPLSMGVWARLQSAHCNAYGFAAPMYYALDTAGGLLSTAAGFNDTILGSNGGYVATPGWDYTTGFGTFDVKAINDALPPVACAANAAPSATLSASATTGAAPFAITFSGANSTDGDGDALDWYVVDFGDGSPVAFSHSATIPPHTYTAPGKYTASLSVRDARGAPSAAATLPVTITGQPLACSAAGVLAITDTAAPSLEGVDPQQGDGSDDLQFVWIGEPAGAQEKLVFTMKVAALASVPSGYRWVSYFTAADGTLYYVSMSTNDGPTPAFTYGIHGYDPAAGASTFQQLGTLDAASNYSADGTITLVLDKAAPGLVAPLHSGDVLTEISASVRVSTADDPSGTAGAGAGLTVDGAGAPNPYVVIGNIACDRIFGGGFE